MRPTQLTTVWVQQPAFLFLSRAPLVDRLRLASRLQDRRRYKQRGDHCSWDVEGNRLEAARFRWKLGLPIPRIANRVGGHGLLSRSIGRDEIPLARGKWEGGVGGDRGYWAYKTSGTLEGLALERNKNKQATVNSSELGRLCSNSSRAFNPTLLRRFALTR